LVTGGTWPGTAEKPGPPPFSPTQPTWFDEKSGGAAFCCAIAGAVVAAPMRPARMLPANTLALKVDEDIVALSSRGVSYLPIRLPHLRVLRKGVDKLVAPFHAPRRRCILLSMNGASIAIKQQQRRGRYACHTEARPQHLHSPSR
jgi:hypothetical protein